MEKQIQNAHKDSLAKTQNIQKITQLTVIIINHSIS